MNSGSAHRAKRPLISLLTDFGLMDPFVGEMKAVILSICPEARIVDISHQVEKYEVGMGAFILASAVPYFPDGTVHIAVVDPGVGSVRRPIVVETDRCLFVGPDNGLMIPAAEREGLLHVYEVTNRSMMRRQVSSTFHGRDIFAPVAAHLACGGRSEECGGEIMDYMRLPYHPPAITGKTATCEVFHIDGFGNIVTNLPETEFSKMSLRYGERIAFSFGRKRFSAKLVRAYADLRGSEFGVLVGSHGFLELACREKSAAQRIKARRGSVLRFCIV